MCVIVWKREAYLCRPSMRISMVLLQFLWKLHVLLPPSAGRKRRNDNDKVAMTAHIATNLLLSHLSSWVEHEQALHKRVGWGIFSYRMSLLYQLSWAFHVHATLCKIVMDPISTSSSLEQRRETELVLPSVQAHSHVTHSCKNHHRTAEVHSHPKLNNWE